MDLPTLAMLAMSRKRPGHSGVRYSSAMLPVNSSDVAKRKRCRMQALHQQNSNVQTSSINTSARSCGHSSFSSCAETGCYVHAPCILHVASSSNVANQQHGQCATTSRGLHDLSCPPSAVRSNFTLFISICLLP